MSRRRFSSPAAMLLMLTWRIEGRSGREGLVQHVGHDALREPLALPPVVVVVADRRQSGLLDEATQRDAERQVHRDRPRVLHEDQVELVHADPVAQDGQEEVGQAVDLGADRTRVAVGVEGGCRGAGGRWPGEVHRRHQARLVAKRVDLAGAEAQVVAHPARGPSPTSPSRRSRRRRRPGGWRRSRSSRPDRRRCERG